MGESGIRTTAVTLALLSTLAAAAPAAAKLPIRNDGCRDVSGHVTCLRDHHGLVLQYIGDEIEAVFGAPVANLRHPDLALRAALEMRHRLAAWNAERAREGRSPLRHGIGIHTGRVLAGNIGSPDRLSWTLVGDPVNVASRLQGLNKDFGSDILLSAETARRLEAPASLEPLSAVTVKGKAKRDEAGNLVVQAPAVFVASTPK